MLKVKLNTKKLIKSNQPSVATCLSGTRFSELVLCAKTKKKNHKEYFKDYKGHSIIWKLKCNACHLMKEMHNKYSVLCFISNLSIRKFYNIRLVSIWYGNEYLCDVKIFQNFYKLYNVK